MSSTHPFIPIVLMVVILLAIPDVSAAESFGNLVWVRLTGTNDSDIACKVVVSGDGVVGLTGRVNGHLTGSSSDSPTRSSALSTGMDRHRLGSGGNSFAVARIDIDDVRNNIVRSNRS